MRVCVLNVGMDAGNTRAQSNDGNKGTMCAFCFDSDISKESISLDHGRLGDRTTISLTREEKTLMCSNMPRYLLVIIRDIDYFLFVLLCSLGFSLLCKSKPLSFKADQIERHFQVGIQLILARTHSARHITSYLKLGKAHSQNEEDVASKSVQRNQEERHIILRFQPGFAGTHKGAAHCIST